MMQYVHEVLNYINSLPPSTWTTLGAYLGASTVVAGILQVLKHRLGIASAKKSVLGLLTFLSFLASFADVIVNSLPAAALGQMTGTILGLSVILHRFLVSPVYYKISEKLTNFATFVDKVSELEREEKANAVAVQSVAATPAGLPANLQQFQI